MPSSRDRLTELREHPHLLHGHDDAVVRTAAGLALRELDRADTATTPAERDEHHAQIGRLLDAALNPEPTTTTTATAPSRPASGR